MPTRNDDDNDDDKDDVAVRRGNDTRAKSREEPIKSTRVAGIGPCARHVLRIGDDNSHGNVFQARIAFARSPVMPQIKIYGLREHLNPIKAQLSDAIHACVVEALSFPLEKRAHRFFSLEVDDFYRPASASPRYVILEIMMIEGRTVETKKRLIRLLFAKLGELGLAPSDIEIAIIESPRENWGFRGQTGDEIALNYRVEM